MIEMIKLAFTWSGLNKQVKELVKTYHKVAKCANKQGKRNMDYYHPKTLNQCDEQESMLIVGVQNQWLMSRKKRMSNML